MRNWVQDYSSSEYVSMKIMTLKQQNARRLVSERREQLYVNRPPWAPSGPMIRRLRWVWPAFQSRSLKTQRKIQENHKKMKDERKNGRKSTRDTYWVAWRARLPRHLHSPPLRPHRRHHPAGFLPDWPWKRDLSSRALRSAQRRPLSAGASVWRRPPWRSTPTASWHRPVDSLRQIKFHRNQKNTPPSNFSSSETNFSEKKTFAVQENQTVPWAALPMAAIICAAMKLTWVLYVAWTERLIRSISRTVSSLPCRTSKSFQISQKCAAT